MRIWTVYDLFNGEVVGSFTAPVQAQREAYNVMREIVENDEVFDETNADINITFNVGMLDTGTYSYQHDDGETVTYISIEANTLS